MNLRIVILVALFVTGIIPVVTFPVSAASTGTILKTVNPPTRGIDFGAAQFGFGANKFTWASGNSNMSILLPSLTVSVTGVACAVAQSSTFTHNSSEYVWTFAGASACNGVALTTAMIMVVQNSTAYNQKEIAISGTTTKAGSAAVVNKVSLSMVSTGLQSVCSAICKVECFAGVCLDWTSLSSFAPVYNNSTDTLAVSSASSTASVITYAFDPTALDGSGKCAIGAAASTCNASLTTGNANDIVIVGCGVNIAGTGARHCTKPTATGLTFLFRTSEADAVANNMSEWYTIATATFTGNVACNESSVGVAACTVFALSDVNTVTPFDPNAALPGKANGVNSKPSVTTVSTTNSADTLIGLMTSLGITAQTGGTCDGGSCTLITSGSALPVVASEYSAVVGVQTSTTVAFGTVTGAGNTWAMIADAIEQGLSTQPIKITTLPAGAPSGTITISGCASPTSNTTFTANGNVKMYSLQQSCVVTLTVPLDLAGSRYRFNVSPHPTASTTITFTTCASGTCSQYNNNTYFQTHDIYEVTPLTPSTWDGSYPTTLTGTYLGTATSICAGGTSSTISGSGVALDICTSSGAFADYNTLVTVSPSLGNTWTAVLPNTFTDTNGIVTHNVNYVQLPKVQSQVTDDSSLSIAIFGFVLGMLALTAFVVLRLRRRDL